MSAFLCQLVTEPAGCRDARHAGRASACAHAETRSTRPALRAPACARSRPTSSRLSHPASPLAPQPRVPSPEHYPPSVLHSAGLSAGNPSRARPHLRNTSLQCGGVPVILGSGVDLMEVARFEREVARRGEGLVEELFSAGELAWCRRRRRPAEGYAMAYAAKEALFKALGTGKVGRMAWHRCRGRVARGSASAHDGARRRVGGGGRGDGRDGAARGGDDDA